MGDLEIRIRRTGGILLLAQGQCRDAQTGHRSDHTLWVPLFIHPLCNHPSPGSTLTLTPGPWHCVPTPWHCPLLRQPHP